MQPHVVDLSHHNIVTDLKAAAASGVWGVIHKASQSYTYTDPTYASRRAMTKAAGLLWGAYHFCTGDDVHKQMDYFLTVAKPDADTLLALDYEDWRASQMSITQLIDACGYAEQKTGRVPVIYSGNTIKDSIAGAGPHGTAFLAKHRLWIPQYSAAVKLPTGFTSWWLWQFSDGVVNTTGAHVPGISGQVDMNAWAGTRDELATQWAGAPLAAG